jgi:hypothetical protein
MALLNIRREQLQKIGKQSLQMASVMIIFLIVHLFKKGQAYSSLFSSALKEGITDTFGQDKKKSTNVGAKRKSMQMTNTK